jgi:hypothetical protein
MNIFEKNEWVQVDIPTSPLNGKRLQIHKVNKETCDFVIDGEILRLYKTGLKSLKYPKVNKELEAVQKSLKAHIKHIESEIKEYSKYNTPMAIGKVEGLEMGLKSLKAILEGQR